jgi:putative transposase
MPRLPRIFIPGLTMHVIQRGAHRADMFHDEGDYEVFLAYLREAVQQNEVEVHAFVLMSNHLHLMATPQHSASLPRTMQQLGRRYVPHYNRRYRRGGTLWQGRYRAIPIETEAYWLTCLRYVEQNPVRAGMVRMPAEYPWSSYHAHGEGEWADWLLPHPVYLALGDTATEREACYRAICGAAIADAELGTLRYAVHHGWAYGSPVFAARIEEACGRPVVPRGARRVSPPNLSVITSGV